MGCHVPYRTEQNTGTKLESEIGRLVARDMAFVTNVKYDNESVGSLKTAEEGRAM